MHALHPEIPTAPLSPLEPVAADVSLQQIALASGYMIEAEAAPRSEMLRIIAPDGRICLKMTLSPEGPQLELVGVSLSVSAQRDIQIRCERLDIQTRDELSIRAGGDLNLASAGDLRSEALTQYHRATVGDLELKANDDVMLNGERIRLNSPRTPTELAARGPCVLDRPAESDAPSAEDAPAAQAPLSSGEAGA